MLNRQNFEIADLAPKDDDRLILCGICVSPERTCVTDGHIVAIVTAPEETQPNLFSGAEDVEPADHFSPFILDRESALKIAKAIPEKSDNAESKMAVIDATTESTDRAMVSINDTYRQEILRAKKIAGTFPDIDRVFPARSAAKFSANIGPALLLSVAKALERFAAAKGSATTQLKYYGPGTALVFSVDGLDQSLTIAMMPQRGDDGEPS